MSTRFVGCVYVFCTYRTYGATEITRMTSIVPQLHKLTVLKALEPRRDPYWGPPIAKGRHVGYRKLDATRGSWIARFRAEDGKFRFQALGMATPTFQFDQAKEAAIEWFSTQDSGVTERDYTVEQACKAYVAAKLADPEGASAASDAENRFKKTVYGTSFGSTPLEKITTVKIKKWRDELPVSNASKNREMTPLRAALNLAIENKKVGAAKAIEWGNVKNLSHVTKSRDVYLDLTQRRKLLELCGDPGDAFYDFVLAHMLTGARPGEISKMKAKQFDSRTKVSTFIGKTRAKVPPRTVPLHDDAIKLFTRRQKGCKPDGLLFTREDGSPWLHDNWNETFKALALAARLPKETVLYSLRHSWITQSLLDGMSTLEVARLTGTSLQMIQDHYGHLVHEQARENLHRVTLV